MSQKAFINYKDELLSFPLIERNMGIFGTGRYTGFDTMTQVNNLIIRIGHSQLSKKTLATGIQLKGFGSFVTPTGTIIHEDASIDLTISSNVGNTNKRTDFIIAEHIYNLIQGGTVATYSILQGPNDGSEPVLTDDSIQCILGKVVIAPGGTTFASLTYEVVAPPPLGATTPQQAYDFIKSLITTDLAGATTTTAGISALATGAEALAGASTQTVITPATLWYVLQNSDVVLDANYVHTANDFTTALLNKLNGIQAGAEVNVNSDWDSTSGDSLILNKPNIVKVLLQGKTIQAFDINGGASGPLSNQGFTSVYRTNGGDSTDTIAFTFPNVGTDSYQVLAEVYTTGAVDSINEWQGMAVRAKSSTGFELVIRETDSEVQSVLLLITLIKHM